MSSVLYREGDELRYRGSGGRTTVLATCDDNDPQLEEHRMPKATVPQVKLVKVEMHASFVVDHGDYVEELVTGTSVIPASEWPITRERWDHDVAELQATIEAQAAQATS